MSKKTTTTDRRSDQGDTLQIVRLPLSKIQFVERRESDEDAINDLAVSMRDIGQINPINVAFAGKNIDGKNTYNVYGGTNRYKAAKKLGWERINAIILKADSDQLRLYEIAENIFRNDPNALEYAELITEYVEIVNRKGVQNAHPGGQQPHDKGISQAAKSLRLTRETVRRSKAIATISPAAKEALKAAKLSHRQKDLLKIAKKETLDDQLAMVAEIANHQVTKKKKTPKPNLQEISSPPIAPGDAELPDTLAVNSRAGDFEKLKDAWEKAPEFVTAWKNASESGRELFIQEVLRRAPVISVAEQGRLL